MKIATIKSNFEPQLRSLAQDSQFVSAVSPDLQHILKPQIVERATISTITPLMVSPFLPQGIALPTTSRKGATDFETLKILAQELILPTIDKIWPAAKPYVAGVQVIWATKEFWAAITDKEVDTTKRSIKGVRALQKAVNALLISQSAPPLATEVNTIAGYLIATADKLYVVRNKAEH